MSGQQHITSWPRPPVEDAIGKVMARLRCEHSHGRKPPRVRPCRRCTGEGQWWGYVMAGHTADVMLALTGVDVDALHAAVAAAREGDGDESLGAGAGPGPDDPEDRA